MYIWQLARVFEDVVCALELMHSNRVLLGDVPAEAIMVRNDHGIVQVMITN